MGSLVITNYVRRRKREDDETVEEIDSLSIIRTVEKFVNGTEYILSLTGTVRTESVGNNNIS